MKDWSKFMVHYYIVREAFKLPPFVHYIVNSQFGFTGVVALNTASIMFKTVSGTT